MRTLALVGCIVFALLLIAPCLGMGVLIAVEDLTLWLKRVRAIWRARERSGERP